MNKYKYLEVIDHEIYREIILNRPEVHNAFNEEFISEITQASKQVNDLTDLRLVVFKSRGKSFCAGADLEWMRKMKNYSLEENIEDSLKLARMFQVINEIRVPVIGLVHGYMLGGGTGLIAAFDYVLADEKSKFGFTEVKLGLVPSVISPYLIRKIGESNARAYFMSGSRFDAAKALGMNLIHEVVSSSNFEDRSLELIESFLQTGPEASVASKKLIFEILKRSSNSQDEINEFTSKLIANLRVGPEAQRGMSAILNKEKINWKKSNE